VPLSQLLYGKRRLAKRESPGESPSPCFVEPQLQKIASQHSSSEWTFKIPVLLTLEAYLVDEVGVVLFTAMPMALRDATSGFTKVKISGMETKGKSSVVVKLNVLFPNGLM